MLSKFPKWIVIQVTDACNLRCKMCYEWGNGGAYNGKQHPSFIDKYLVKKIVEECKEVHPRYELFGGEPLLHPQIIEIIRCIKQTECYLEFPTNGTLLCKYAEELVESGVDRIWVSIDGPEDVNDAQRGNGSYNSAVQGISELIRWKEKLNRKTPEIGVSCVVTPYNMHSLVTHVRKLDDSFDISFFNFELQTYLSTDQLTDYEMWTYKHFGINKISKAKGFLQYDDWFTSIDYVALHSELHRLDNYCKEKGVAYRITPCKVLESANILQLYFSGQQNKASSRHICPIVWLHCEVNVHGDVTPCHAFYDVTFGNIKNESITSIWNGNKLRRYRSLIKHNQQIPICSACCRFFG